MESKPRLTPDPATLSELQSEIRLACAGLLHLRNDHGIDPTKLKDIIHNRVVTAENIHDSPTDSSITIQPCTEAVLMLLARIGFLTLVLNGVLIEHQEEKESTDESR